LAEREQWADDVWAVNEYIKERLNILMTFSDAKECTFKPFINRDGKKLWTLKHWIEKMGENFEKKFPMIFKYGVYRRAYIFYKKREYR